MKFLADENLTGPIIRGLLRHIPDIDLVRVQDVGLLGVEDPEILEWAATEGRILLTHDIRTMPTYAYQSMAQGKSISGIITMKSTLEVRRIIIEDMRYIIECTTINEWTNQIMSLPL